jgi:hypothetical protein
VTETANVGAVKVSLFSANSNRADFVKHVYTGGVVPDALGLILSKRSKSAGFRLGDFFG